MIHDVIEAAKNYNFDAVKEFLSEKNSVNKLSPLGSSLFTIFVAGYYNTFEYEEIRDDEEAFFHPEVLLPLSERKDPIEEQLLYLLSLEANPNLLLLNDGDSELALQYAVANLDIPMIELNILLKHGADPKTWVSIDEKIEAKYPYSHWNMDDLDITLINGVPNKKETIDLVIKAAVLLAQNGIEEYYGTLLKVENRKVCACGRIQYY